MTVSPGDPWPADAPAVAVVLDLAALGMPGTYRIIALAEWAEFMDRRDREKDGVTE